MVLNLFKALADPTRLRLVAILSRGEFTVRELTRILSMGQSRVSRHLKIMLEADVVTLKRQGTWSYYRLNRENSLFLGIFESIEEASFLSPESETDLGAVSDCLEERRRRSREFFDRHARQWDDLARQLLPTPDYLEKLVDLVPESGPVLEVGIGTGRLIEMLRNRGCRVIGVDHSPAMLEEAGRFLRTGEEAGIGLRLGEMSHLPVSDSAVGTVVLNMVLHHAPDPPAVLAEGGRVLRPGGMIIIADLKKHSHEWVRDRLADQWLGFEEGDLSAWLGRAGFSPPRFISVPGNNGQQDVLLLRAVRK